MSSTRTRIAASIAAAAGIAALAAAPAQAAAPDTGCMQAGIATLQGRRPAHSAVAKDGVTVGTAVSLGVTAAQRPARGRHPRHRHPVLDAAGRPPRR